MNNDIIIFFMKKYLAKCLVAVSVMGMVSSCAHDEETSIYNEVQSNYIQAFNNTFGTPAEDQDWGFDQVMTSEARTTRAMGDYNGYKGSMQPVEWYQDTNDWTMKTRIYTFPSAPDFPTSRPSNAEYYSGGYKYFNGGSFYMDENTSKHVEIQGYCDMYVVKSGTGSGNVTIESTTKWYVGNVPYGSFYLPVHARVYGRWHQYHDLRWHNEQYVHLALHSRLLLPNLYHRQNSSIHNCHK